MFRITYVIYSLRLPYVCSNTLEGLGGIPCVDDDRRDRVEEDTLKLTQKKEFEGILRILLYFLPFISLPVFFSPTLSSVSFTNRFAATRIENGSKRAVGGFEGRKRICDSCKIEASCDRSTGTNERTAKDENCSAETRI